MLRRFIMVFVEAKIYEEKREVEELWWRLQFLLNNNVVLSAMPLMLDF